ncbi:MAG: DEAD/DEAH box helicase family protein [Thermodesulfobacteriota bacterium]
MNRFADDIRFCFPWRPYQQRVLAELEEHLEDDRLHVIAPPGSGKTVLGLEVVRRLDRPALILAPTLAIRDQWIDRFVELFLPEPGHRPDWISTDLKRPGFMTVGTYQGVYSLHSGEPEPTESNGESEEADEEEPEDADSSPPAKSRSSAPDSFAHFRISGVRTIVVDEAHHLKNAWWKSLTALHGALDHPTVVALTATPPFDVSFAEWERYKSLCGPVDSEITVPELLLEQNLCPHQDYVFFSSPTELERRPIQEFHEAVDTFLEEIALDFDFIDGVESHPWLISPEDHLEAIFSDTACFSSMLIFLNHVDRWISSEALDTLGVDRTQIPTVTPEWMELLLTYALFKDPDSFAPVAPRMKEIRRQLSRIGAVERRKVVLQGTQKIKKNLTASLSKLESIVEVVRVESESLKHAMRMVVLTDFIYAGDMPTFIDDMAPLNRIGVVPVFERIRREHLWEIRPGILCGSLTVIPESAVSDLQMIAVESGVALDRLRFEPLGHDPGFLIVRPVGAAGDRMVRMMTELFRLGGVNLLVGTKSLLGEGWDAPFINSLVLATWVGSWVLSNQMRGRAIRTESGDPDKTANIWHLVCAVPGMAQTEGDLALLNRRLKAFVGVSSSGDRIENGADRLDLPSPPLKNAVITDSNTEMIRRATDRHGLRAAWEAALKGCAGEARMVEEVKAPAAAAAAPGRILVRNSTVLLVKQLTGLLLLGSVLTAFTIGFGHPVLSGAAAVLFGGFCLWLLPATVRAACAWFRFGADAAGLRCIGQAVLDTLIHLGHIRQTAESTQVCVHKEPDGGIACRLQGGSTFEKSLFLDALQEVIGPVENPRYLIRLDRKRVGKRVEDFFAVPRLIARKKASALFFRNRWRKHLCRADLVYTRTVEGRKELVKARLQTIQGLRWKSDRMQVWK